MPLVEVVSSGHSMLVRSEATDGAGGNWDERIVREVIERDCYGLVALKARFPSFSTILDVGANIGAFCVFARSLWPMAHIVAAEPFQENYYLAARNAHKVGNISMMKKAVIGTNDKLVGFKGPSFCTHTDAYKNGGDGQVDRNQPTKVAGCTLEDIIIEHGPIDLMKIDCEGGELEIFETASAATLRCIGIVRGEWHSDDAVSRLTKAFKATHNFKVTKIEFSNLGTFEAEPYSLAKTSPTQ